MTSSLKTIKSQAKDSEQPSELDEMEGKMEVQDVNNGDSEMRFVLSAERYLVGKDIRGLVNIESNKYGCVCWNDSRVYALDRDKPDAVIQFNMPFGESHAISMRLIPFYEPNLFPFAIVLC